MRRQVPRRGRMTGGRDESYSGASPTWDRRYVSTIDRSIRRSGTSQMMATAA